MRLDGGSQSETVENIKRKLEKQEERNEWERIRKDLDEMLTPRVSVDVAGYANIERRCLAGTRVTILNHIVDWAADVTPNSPPLLWITGMPGSGKSTIATSVAEEFDNAAVLAGQYFFRRENDNTTNARAVFPSIAWQLAKRFSAVATALCKVLKNGPSLPRRLDEAQVKHLFIEPLKNASELDPTTSVVVVFDALDESNQVTEFVKLLASAIAMLPPNVKILITSRPENDVFSSLSSLPMSLTKQIILNPDDSSSINDVNLFIKHEFVRIIQHFNSTRREDRLESDWPGEKRINDLFSQASGLFVWAKTAMIFISERLKDGKQETEIDQMFDLLKAGQHQIGPFKSIDVLYLAILRDVYPDSTSESKIRVFRRVIGALTQLREPLGLEGLNGLLFGTAKAISSEDDAPDFLAFFGRLRSILVPDASVITHSTIPRVHKSFFDFIRDESRCRDPRFCINSISAVESDLVRQCLRTLHTLRRDICDIHDPRKFNNEIDNPPLGERVDQHIPSSLRYACRFWAFHLPRIYEPYGELNELLKDFFFTHLLHWFEVMSLLGMVRDAELLLSKASDWAKVC